MRPLAALVLLMLALAGCNDTGNDPGDGPGGATGCAMPDEPGAGENPLVVMETNLGCITAEIFVDKVPNTGGNFVALAADGHYDGVPFHRIITDFMMQGGDYTKGNGQGGAAHPDFDRGGGAIQDEFDPTLRHDRAGLLSMANSGPNTGGSQFFITFAPTPWLDDKHAIFGEVVAGMDVVERVNEEAGTKDGSPAIDVTLEDATVVGAVPEPEPPAPALLVADAITPGTWKVTDTSDSILVWVHNDGEAMGDYTFSMDVPDGWNVTFDEPSGSVRGDAIAWTLARITVPEDASGSHEATLHAGNGSTPIQIDVDLGSPAGKEGDKASVVYRGTCTGTGEEFDEGGFDMTLGQGSLITGFKHGLVGVADGETVVLVLPEDLAYGPNGRVCTEQDPSDLTFEITLTLQ